MFKNSEINQASLLDLGALALEDRQKLEKKLLEEIEQEGASWRFKSFQSDFFGELDYYMAWHDGIESVANYNNLEKLPPKEKVTAEIMLYNALEKEYDERWLTGLVKLKAKTSLPLLKKVFEHEQYLSVLIKTAKAILTFEPEADQLNFLLDVINSDGGEYFKIDALTEIKILFQEGIYREKTPSCIVESLFQALKDSSYLVRYHAYDTINILYNFPRQIDDDPLFLLLLPSKNMEDFIKAEKMIKEKIKRQMASSIF